jgi:nucleoside-diphosphate-sugar epimerase
MTKLKVLLTGAAGRVGRALRPAFRECYQLRTFDRQAVPDDPEALIGDLTDLGCMRTAMRDIEVLVHLAATPTERAFVEELAPNNIVGVYNAFQAAREAGVRRIVFASTCQTVTAYPTDRTVEVTDPVRPRSIYGATKVFGEVLGRYYHDHHGLEFVGIRLGAFISPERVRPHGSSESRLIWIGQRDAVNLFRRAVETPHVGYLLVFGTSITDREYLSLKTARETLGYQPEERLPQLPVGAMQP